LPVAVLTTSALKPRLASVLSCHNPENPRVIVSAFADGARAAAVSVIAAIAMVASLLDIGTSGNRNAANRSEFIVANGRMPDNEHFHPAT
jgi:hypothetical protein